MPEKEGTSSGSWRDRLQARRQRKQFEALFDEAQQNIPEAQLCRKIGMAVGTAFSRPAQYPEDGFQLVTKSFLFVKAPHHARTLAVPGGSVGMGDELAFGLFAARARVGGRTIKPFPEQNRDALWLATYHLLDNTLVLVGIRLPHLAHLVAQNMDFYEPLINTIADMEQTERDMPGTYRNPARMGPGVH
jgi:hypothetical protein